jgi:hypothetical protein
LGNAVKLQNLGCAVLAKNTEQLRMAVKKVEVQKQLFKSKVEALNRFANRFKGLDRAVEVIENIGQ